MPFNPFRRSTPSPEPPPEVPRIPPGEIAFEGLTEDWHLVGTIQIEGRLSDVLNRRERLPIAGVYWEPLDASEPFTEAPGLREIDPYDLIVVFTGKDSVPDRDEETERAMRVRKVNYDVALDLGLLRVTGRVYMYPGTQPAQLLDRRQELFLPITRGTAYLAGRVIGNENADVLLVNQTCIRGVETIESGAPEPGRLDAPGRASRPGDEAAPDGDPGADQDTAGEAVEPDGGSGPDDSATASRAGADDLNSWAGGG